MLEVFELYMKSPSYHEPLVEKRWRPLVHVCRRWRSLVFGSPRRLELQLHCTPETPARDRLDIWPALPLVVEGSMVDSGPDADNVFAALEQSNRVCSVNLDLWVLQLEQLFAVMQVPFPQLRDLQLSVSFHDDETLPVTPVPDSFLGGSAPLLESFSLDRLPYPSLPKLLLSSAHLVDLELFSIPHSGYISPEAMVALLCTLSSLESLSLGFQSPQSRPDSEIPSLPPPRRSILPALDQIQFEGATEYLEDLVTRINTPRLNKMHTTFFNQIDFDCSQLVQFISCAPALRAHDDAHVKFNDWETSVTLPAGPRSRTLKIATSIPCVESNWQLSSVAKLCNSSLPRPSTVRDLYIDYQYSQLAWKNDAIDTTLWLELLLPFTAVESLYLSNEFAPGIAAALQEFVGGSRITEVLPKLKIISVEGLKPSKLFEKNIREFVAARQLSNESDYPIHVSVWDRLPVPVW